MSFLRHGSMGQLDNTTLWLVFCFFMHRFWDSWSVCDCGILWESILCWFTLLKCVNWALSGISNNSITAKKYHRRPHDSINLPHSNFKTAFQKQCQCKGLFVLICCENERGTSVNMRAATLYLCVHICPGSTHWFDYTTQASSFCTNLLNWNRQLILNAQCRFCMYCTQCFSEFYCSIIK